MKAEVSRDDAPYLSPTGFSALSSNLPLEALKSQLNEYGLTHASTPIHFNRDSFSLKTSKKAERADLELEMEQQNAIYYYD
jgi:hypothetical protein